MKRAECIGFVITLIISIICAALIVWGLIDGYEKDNDKVFIFYIVPIINMSYTVMYIVVIVELNRVMAKMDGNLRNEKKSVNCQFLTFLFA